MKSRLKVLLNDGAAYLAATAGVFFSRYLLSGGVEKLVFDLGTVCFAIVGGVAATAISDWVGGKLDVEEKDKRRVGRRRNLKRRIFYSFMVGIALLSILKEAPTWLEKLR